MADVMAGANQFRDRHPFAPLLQQLAKSKYNHDPARPAMDQAAFFKTHKTGSSTLASVLFRRAARHAKRIFTCHCSTVLDMTVSCWRLGWDKSPHPDRLSYHYIMHHLSSRGDNMGTTLLRVFDLYRNVITSPVVVTLMRNPLQQSLSWLSYYYTTQSIDDVESLMQRGFLPDNIQLREFCPKDRPDFERFVKVYFEKFELFCISEMFDECLVMMRRRYNWDMLDITYIRLLDSEEIRSVLAHCTIPTHAEAQNPV